MEDTRGSSEKVVATMARFDLTIVEMAGNDDILFTAIGPDSHHDGALFSFPRQGYGDHRHLFMVKTRDLLQVLAEMEDSPLKVEHVHDY